MNPNAHAPVRQLTLYRHGQARWLRHARFEGDTLDLHLPGTALDTLIKSCTVHPAPGTGTRVLGMEHDPSGQAWPGALMPQLGRSGLLRQWLGCEVVVETEAGGLQGRVAGVETGEETGVGQPMRQKDRAAAAGQEVPDKPERHVLLLCDAEGRLHPLPLAHLRSVQPVDAAERQRLQDALRASDVLSRIGGEEFMVALPGATRDEALGLAERLRAAIAATPIGHGALQLPVSVSLGVALLAPGESPEQLLARADEIGRAHV